MKNIFLIISLFIVSYAMKAQTIIPIERTAEYLKENKGKVPKSKYYKDVNKVLDKYVGEWEGTYNNKIFYFKISKQIKFISPVSNSTHSDRLKVQYRVTDKKTGKVIQDKFKTSSKQITDGMVEF